jgi:glycosyltransferase involved in cell wall biosynthesis
MKVVHVPFSYYPDAVGGTEVYVQALAREQQREAIESIVAAPADRTDAYRHADISVRRFHVAQQVSNVRELYGDGDPLAAKGFSAVLESEKPDLVHLHAFTRGVSLALVREAKLRGIPVIFTYHTPTVTCQRGTMLRWGVEVCDGTLDLTNCTQCSLHGLGLNAALSTAAAWVPIQWGKMVGRTGRSGGLWTALRMTELVALRHDTVRSLLTEVDHIVAVCEWVKDVLRRNHVPEEKITVSRQGLCQSEVDIRPHDSTQSTEMSLPLRLAFFGRLDPTKGVHILVQALRMGRALPISLDVHGVTQGDSGTAYLHQLQRMATGDSRITFKSPVPPESVVSRMREYHAVTVPSQWLETGPLVILEAFAAGVPVIGSKLGGIAELVTDRVNGLLVEPSSVEAWSNVFKSLCRDPTRLNTLRETITPPRCSPSVAMDMRLLYSHVLGAAKPR